MDLVGLAGDIVGTVLSGGATGLVGVAIQRFADYKNKKLDLERERQQQDFEIRKRQEDAKVIDAEWNGRLKVATAEGETARDVAETGAFSATVWKAPERWADPRALTSAQNWLMVVMDALWGAVRPALTVYLCVMVHLMWMEVHTKLSVEDLDGSQALQIWLLVVKTVLYLATTVVLWWFGTRNKASQPNASLPR
jgi:hypothetical protein